MPIEREHVLRVACEMVSFHPYCTWPLHVKLFTDEAVKKWAEAAKATGALPVGLTVITELEGVDGKSGKTGLGRQGPIDVTDGTLLDVPSCLCLFR